MLLVPAIVLGVLALLAASFFVGFQCAFRLVSFIRFIINRKSNEEVTKRDFEDNLTAGISVVIGIFTAVFAFFSVDKYNQSHSGETWVSLVVIGFIVSILSFLIPAIRINEREFVLPNNGRAGKVIDIDYEGQRTKTENKREHSYKRYSATLNRYELFLSMMLRGWIHFISKFVPIKKLFSDVYLAILIKLLEKYIRINQVKVIEPFAQERKKISERVLEFLVGVIEIDGVRIVVLLDVMNDSSTSITFSPYIVYLYNVRLDNMIIYFTNKYDETASALIASVKEDKTISLLKLDTMMAEIKKHKSYSQYLKNVIMQNNMH
ncbi:MAG: hypothetical protein QM730_17390 [Anaerolineales bacterium]